MAPHDGVPVVKVIDFGVAKAIGQQLTEKTIYTRFAQMIGTPLYMSPEQAEINAPGRRHPQRRLQPGRAAVRAADRDDAVRPRSGSRRRPIDEIRRIIREEEPPKPSTRLSTLGEALSTVSRSGRPSRRSCRRWCAATSTGS